MKLVHYQLIPVNLKKKVTYDNGQSERVLYTPQIAENPQMMSLLTPFQNKGKAQLQVKIGSVNGHLEGDRSKVRFVQTNMGHLLLAAQMARSNADFAVMSGGGIRDSIEAGDITYKDVMKVQPFGNCLLYTSLPSLPVCSCRQASRCRSDANQPAVNTAYGSTALSAGRWPEVGAAYGVHAASALSLIHISGVWAG